jgi:predicted ArsR family transcriptional regulator
VDARRFENTLADLAAILGDPTRRGIYLHIRGSDRPPTASELADVFGIHPNVARHHLDRLIAEGYLEVAEPPADGRGGAGRPPRHYRATGKEITISYPPRRLDLLAELLLQVVEQMDPADGGRVAEEVGRRYGRELAAAVGIGGSPPEAALRAVSGALGAIGFGTIEEPTGNTLLTHHCPFGTTAEDHPEIVCRIDRGIVRGLLEVARGDSGPVVLKPHGGPAAACVAEV